MMNKKKKASVPSDPPARNLRLTVKNFGPIAKGEIDLRPLTVFAGPSNTGKSWLATLIYVFERHLNGDSFGEFGFALRRRLERHQKKSTAFPENPEVWLESIRNDREALPLTESDKEVLASALEGRQEELEEELRRCFGLSELGHLARESGRYSASVTIVDDHATRSPAVGYHCKITRKGKLSFQVNMPNDWRVPLVNHSSARQRFVEEIEYQLRNKETESRSSSLERNLFDFPLFAEPDPDSFYLPADRGGVMHAHHVVVGALIWNAPRAGLSRNAPLPMMSGVLGDFLQNLLEVADGNHRRYMRRPLRRGRKPDDGRADRLETNVLNGRVRVEKSNVDYPRFTYSPDGWKRSLSLVGVSSMVSELAPVALYLRHHVREGDLLILEEPEAHLHPAMQVAFVREIAQWVRQGIRVVLTTHSEWVLEELANIVAAGEAGQSDGLGRQTVGMWLFEPQQGLSGATRIREIEWDPDEGGFATDFDDVARNLHNRWAELMNRSQ